MSLFGKDYDQVSVGGDYIALPAGGYICRILQARLTESKTSGLPMVEALIDIIDGEYTGYFTKKYQQNKKGDPNAQFPNNGKVRVVAVDENGNTKKMFKSFCTAVEQSNDLTLPRNDNAFIKALKDKEVGIIFGREEFEGSDGKTHWSTKPRFYRSVETIANGDYTTPDDQYLDRGSVPTQSNNDLFTGNGIDGSFSELEESLPF